MAAEENQVLEVKTHRCGAKDTIFYDGSCGLCHWTVRFVLHRDRTRGAFRFAPLGGPTFQQGVSVALRQDLPDSLVVKLGDGRLLVRSAGVLHIMRCLGGIWRLLAGVVDLVPDRVLDLGYDGIARLRRLLFKRPQRTCPTADADLLDRFDP